MGSSVTKFYDCIPTFDCTLKPDVTVTGTIGVVGLSSKRDSTDQSIFTWGGMIMKMDLATQMENIGWDLYTYVD